MAESGKLEKDLTLVEEFATVRALTAEGKSVQVPKSKFGGNLEIASESVLGGIKAAVKTEEYTEEVKIDPTTGKAYVKPSSEVTVATADKVGGIIAAAKTESETVEVKIDNETGKLYVPEGDGTPPDNEDIHIATVEGVEVLQFNDKAYSASSYSGLGRVYLRKNIVNGVNVLTQDMIPSSNTHVRYIIQYDYDLQGAEITIPEDCVLEFNGGSLRNGKLVGNDTRISANSHVFHIGLSLQGFYEIHAEWIGIVPEKDCSAELEFFSQFGLTILFRRGRYQFSLANLKLSRYTSLIGLSQREDVIFSVTPKAEYDYIFGLSYHCAIKNIYIRYYNSNGYTNGDIIRISNAFATAEDVGVSSGSDYEYDVVGVRVDGVWKEDGDYSDGVTALAIHTNEADNVVEGITSLSWLPRVSFFRCKFTKVGIHIQTHSTTANKFWQNSLLFENLMLHAKYGIWFDREGGWSHGYCLVNNYIFQSTEKTFSFGLYGTVSSDRINNYYSWDNYYPGCISGSIYLNDTAFGKFSGEASVDLPDGYIYREGFLVPEGKGLRINVVGRSQAIYIPTDYNPSEGDYIKVDYSTRGTRKYYPRLYNSDYRIEETYDITSPMAPKKIESVYGVSSKPSYQKTQTCKISDYTEQEVVYDGSVPRYCIIGSKALPTKARYQVSSFVEDYNFKTFVFHVAPRSISSITLYSNIIYRVEFTFSSEADTFSACEMVVKNLTTSIGSITRSFVNGKVLVVYVKFGSGTASSENGFKIATTLLFTRYTDDLTDPAPKNITGERTAISMYRIAEGLIGYTADRPVSTNLLDAGYCFFDRSLNKPIWWDGSKWIDATGTNV